jgi:class 3 adenylate cyclase
MNSQISTSAVSAKWNQIISIGLKESHGDWQKRRIRLLNGISFIAVVFLLAYGLLYKNVEHDIIFWESMQGSMFYAIILFSNYKGFHNFACHLFSFYSVLFFTFLSILHGKYIAAEYILVPSSIASMLIFRNYGIIVSYFILNVVCFAISKYIFTQSEPLLYMPEAKSLYIGNHINMFLNLFLIVTYFKSETIRQEKLLETQNKSLTLEQQKSENLLLNILPRETAEELKQMGSARSRRFDSVTILFSDFKNFTHASEQMSPEQLVNEIHQYYSYFDSVMEKYGIEKIKTIGDAYMCAGGIPDENTTHAIDIVNAAIEMQQYVEQQKLTKIAAGEIFFEIRIGIHTGSVVAGIVGTKKFAYDIWGDTVNLASRMESSGEVGRINISATTYELVKNTFKCEYRGKISVKNKGEIDMYFVSQQVA